MVINNCSIILAFYFWRIHNLDVPVAEKTVREDSLNEKMRSKLGTVKYPRKNRSKKLKKNPVKE